jgi:hypothetical protein
MSVFASARAILGPEIEILKQKFTIPLSGNAIPDSGIALPRLNIALPRLGITLPK